MGWVGSEGKEKRARIIGCVWSTYQFVLERTDQSDTSSCYSTDLRRRMETMSLEQAFFMWDKRNLWA